MRPDSNNKKRFKLTRAPLATAIWLAMSSLALAQDSAPAADPEAAAKVEDGEAVLETITVTAQKRTENLQDVPISMQVLGTDQIEELHIADIDDVFKLSPSVSFQRQAELPGSYVVYMRGVASGGDGNHSASQPSVGIYLDEQPVTTAQGALDVHLYDMERVETLVGPQGTLYGASSQAGTIRFITNKPDASGFAAGYSGELNSLHDGDAGNVAEGFVNVPLSDNVAIRLVGWSRSDAGYIDNVRSTRTFPTSGITMDNADRAREDYNYADTVGARAALKVDLNDRWSVTPTLNYQRTHTNGIPAQDELLGQERALSHFYPETSNDEWVQAALTIQGKIGNFDLTYAYSNLDRDIDSEADYNDYGFWYDTLLGYGAYFYDNAGDLVNPSQYIQAADRFKKSSHEIRLASPTEDRLRFVAGYFRQDQEHKIQQRYRIDDLADDLSVTGWPSTIWLTQQVRDDQDQAFFGELSYDFTEQLTGTVGARYFDTDNSLAGFFGFSNGYFPSSDYGEASCGDESTWVPFNGAPCTVFDKNVKEDGWLGRVNLAYHIDDTKMIYGTWSEGFRPGGINRRGTLDPYLSDFLTNMEFGWKTSWADNSVTFNGAVFQEDWEDFQFALLGANGLTEIKNANQAEIRGLELDLQWAATYSLRLSAGLAFYDAELSENYCGFTDADGNPETNCPAGTIPPGGDDPVDGPEAVAGTRLPVTADFKGNVTARYTFDLGEFEAFWQGSVIHEGERSSDLRDVENAIIGNLDSYTTLDLTAGLRRDNWSIDVYVKNATDENVQNYRFVQCPESICGDQAYTIVAPPRTFGIRFSQEF